MSRERRRNAVAVAVSLALACAAAEVLLRVSGLAEPAWVRPDPVIGWSYVPGAHYVHRGEGASSGRISSAALRDVEHALSKSPDTYRILILGDSFSEAIQVPLEQSYPRLLEQRLNAVPGVGPVEVINMSRAGMGTAQERVWFLANGLAYQPDLVLLQTYLNDPADNSPDLGTRDEVPYYRFDDGRLVRDDSFRTAPGYRLRSVLSRIRASSALVEVLWQGLRRALVRPPQDIRQAQRDGLAPDALENQYLANPPQKWREALALTDAVLAALVDDVHRSGARMVVFVATDGIELEESGQTSARELGLDLDQRERWWWQASMQHGAEFVPTLAAFRLRRRETGERAQGFGPQGDSGHWNAYGHAWAAEILGEGLAPMIRADRLVRDPARTRAQEHASAPDPAEIDGTVGGPGRRAEKRGLASGSGN